jgi:hypothetical protein
LQKVTQITGATFENRELQVNERAEEGSFGFYTNPSDIKTGNKIDITGLVDGIPFKHSLRIVRTERIDFCNLDGTERSWSIINGTGSPAISKVFGYLLRPLKVDLVSPLEMSLASPRQESEHSTLGLRAKVRIEDFKKHGGFQIALKNRVTLQLVDGDLRSVSVKYRSSYLDLSGGTSKQRDETTVLKLPEEFDVTQEFEFWFRYQDGAVSVQGRRRDQCVRTRWLPFFFLFSEFPRSRCN